MSAAQPASTGSQQLPFTFDTLCNFLADHHKRIRVEDAGYVESAKRLYQDLQLAASPSARAEALTGEQLKSIALKHRTIVAGFEFADKLDFDAIAAEIRALGAQPEKGEQQ